MATKLVNSECETDDVAARRERANRIHQQIDQLKQQPAAAVLNPPKSPRDFIADRMRSIPKAKKK